MTSLPTWVTPFVEQVEAQSATPAWLQTVRQQGLARFANEGWPTSRLEAWRHTSLALLDSKQYQLAEAFDAKALVESCKNNEQAYWLVFVDGQFAADLSSTDMPTGVSLRSVAEVCANEPTALETIYGQADDGFSPDALNLGLAQDGAFVRVSRAVQVEKPIHLVFVSGPGNCAAFTRNFIALEAGAHATVVEHYISADDFSGLSNAVTRVWTDRDANLVHFKLQTQSENAVHLASIDAEQEQNSYYESHSFSFGAQLARTNITTRFNGERCHTLLNGLYYTNERRHVDHYTQIHHAVPNCTSHEYYRGIMADRGRGVFSGRIVVHKGADGTDAIQRSDSLLLSKMAKADSKPELEIYADDVKCAHGATVGQIDEDSLFYLRSRGLDREDAFNLLIYAFAAEVLERVQSEALRQRATAGIQSRLPGASQLGE